MNGENMNAQSFDSTEQLMVKLAYCAYCSFMSVNPQAIHEAIGNVLAKHTPHQHLVWGPAEHRAVVGLFTNALMFVVKDTATGQYTVVVRGTNPVSLDSWLLEDLMVARLVPWDKEKEGEKRMISKGTENALEIHLDKADPADGIPGAGTKIFDYLVDLLKNSKGKVILNFTGHSLGGLMAPTLALWVKEHLPPELLEKADIRVYAFAGPTAGNKEFAEYCDQMLGDKCMRYPNTLDVVTHVWNADSIRNLETLYTEYMDKALEILIDIVYKVVENKEYTQLKNFKSVPSQFVSSLDSFTEQATFQHLPAYVFSVLAS
ncbi:MAG: lipase family protein, partial [bacterium]|nr:lipase family protein [bacterium]